MQTGVFCSNVKQKKGRQSPALSFSLVSCQFLHFVDSDRLRRATIDAGHATNTLTRVDGF